MSTRAQCGVETEYWRERVSLAYQTWGGGGGEACWLAGSVTQPWAVSELIGSSPLSGLCLTTAWSLMPLLILHFSLACVWKTSTTMPQLFRILVWKVASEHRIVGRCEASDISRSTPMSRTSLQQGAPHVMNIKYLIMHLNGLKCYVISL